MTNKERGGGGLAAWTVEASRHVLRDRWISVRADTCRTAEGTVVAPFYILEYADWVQIVAIDAADRLILLKQYRHGLGLISLELPTGSIEVSDDDAIAAAMRELEEETGLVSDDWRQIATLAANPANQTNRCHVVIARDVRPGGTPANDPTERVRMSHVPLTAAGQLVRSGAIVQSMHVAALALALTELGHW